MRRKWSDSSLNGIPFTSRPLSPDVPVLTEGEVDRFSLTHELTAVTARARPPGGTLALVGCHATASIQARQDADSCH